MAAERILIVDDDESIRQIVRICLTDEGYEVFEAPNGQVALDTLARVHAQLDPARSAHAGHGRLGVCAALRDNCPGRTRPIVAFVAALNAEQECADLDAAGILAKPFDLDDLLRAVRNLLPRVPR